MALPTYLDIVNKVLKRLREDTVTTVTYNTYSTLIGEFVNDAKREVEDSWAWKSLRHTVTFDSDGSLSVFDLSEETALEPDLIYSRLTNAGSRLIYDSYGRPLAFDRTDGEEVGLRQITLNDMSYKRNTDNNEDEPIPTEFAITTKPSNTNIADGIEVIFRVAPEAGRTYTFFFSSPQLELEDDDEVLLVPWQPVMYLAYIYALNERGEEIGEPGSQAWRRYNTSLAQLIAGDSVAESNLTTFLVP